MWPLVFLAAGLVALAIKAQSDAPASSPAKESDVSRSQKITRDEWWESGAADQWVCNIERAVRHVQ